MTGRERFGCVATAAAAALALCCAGEPRGDCNPNPQPGELGTICGFANPEDVEVIATLGALVISEMRHATDGPGGALAYLDLAAHPPVAHRLWPDASGSAPAKPPARPSDCSEPPAASQFSPHGIAARAVGGGRVELAVVSHAPREAIEFFVLQREGGVLRASWRGCAPFPPDATGNDVAFGEGSTRYATRYQSSRSQPRIAIDSVLAGLGMDTGAVFRVEAGAWETLPESGGASPNGVAVSRATGEVFFAQTGTGLVTVLRDGTAVDIPIGGNPDNLANSESNQILAVTHTDGIAFLRCALGGLPCRTGWSLYEIEPETLAVRLLLVGDGDAVGAVTSVAQHRERYFFGAVFDDRIGLWSAAGPN